MTLTINQKKLLNALIDKYENSSTFRGTNKVNQSFSIKPINLFSKYADVREYDFFVNLNQDIDELKKQGYIDTDIRNGEVIKIYLRLDDLEAVYNVLKRDSKRTVLDKLDDILLDEQVYIEKLDDAGNTDVKNALTKYIAEQKDRLSKGKYPECYDGDMAKYLDLWKALRNLLDIQEEVYVRDFSIRLYRDSKRLELLRNKIDACLYKYGDYPNKDKILEELGVVKTPSYVTMKGPIEIVFSKNNFDVGKLTGDIAFSTKTLRDITAAKVNGSKIITVENLTTFHSYNFDEDSIVIYLGGYHNQVKRDFLKIIYNASDNIRYYHFGDIDAGGFYIYEHLRRMTNIPFEPFNMSVQMLIDFQDYAKELTHNDVTRINKLIQRYNDLDINNPNKDDIINTLVYMLNNNIKLEQESIDMSIGR